MSLTVVALVVMLLVAVGLLIFRRTAKPPDARSQELDARRFAKLLVAEIKLYNQVRVAEGRASKDLYRRLKEEIDRARRMYDERVDTSVAARAEYFDEELVRELAGGDASALGGDYQLGPKATDDRRAAYKES